MMFLICPHLGCASTWVAWHHGPSEDDCGLWTTLGITRPRCHTGGFPDIALENRSPVSVTLNVLVLSLGWGNAKFQ